MLVRPRCAPIGLHASGSAAERASRCKRDSYRPSRCSVHRQWRAGPDTASLPASSSFHSTHDRLLSSIRRRLRAQRPRCPQCPPDQHAPLSFETEFDVWTAEICRYNRTTLYSPLDKSPGARRTFPTPPGALSVRWGLEVTRPLRPMHTAASFSARCSSNVNAAGAILHCFASTVARLNCIVGGRFLYLPPCVAFGHEQRLPSLLRIVNVHSDTSIIPPSPTVPPLPSHVLRFLRKTTAAARGSGKALRYSAYERAFSTSPGPTPRPSRCTIVAESRQNLSRYLTLTVISETLLIGL